MYCQMSGITGFLSKEGYRVIEAIEDEEMMGIDLIAFKNYRLLFLEILYNMEGESSQLSGRIKKQYSMAMRNLSGILQREHDSDKNTYAIAIPDSPLYRAYLNTYGNLHNLHPMGNNLFYFETVVNKSGW